MRKISVYCMKTGILTVSLFYDKIIDLETFLLLFKLMLIYIRIFFIENTGLKKYDKYKT